MLKLTPRLRPLATYLGVLVVAGGLALATLGPHPARAEIANPKQRFIDQMNADLAHAKSSTSQSAPITGGKPSVAPVDLSQYGDGFVETPKLSVSKRILSHPQHVFHRPKRPAGSALWWWTPRKGSS